MHHRISNDTQLGKQQQKISSKPKKKIPKMDVILEQQKKSLSNELEFFGYSEETIKNYTLDSNGNPVRLLIVSYFRSGSQFLVEALKSSPGFYYHHEPLMVLEKPIIRGPPNDLKSIDILKRLFNCQYHGPEMKIYRNFGKSHEKLHRQNDIYWDICKKYSNYCNKVDLLENLCQMYPFQLMRVSRLKLRIAAKLLQDERFSN